MCLNKQGGHPVWNFETSKKGGGAWSYDLIIIKWTLSDYGICFFGGNPYGETGKHQSLQFSSLLTCLTSINFLMEVFLACWLAPISLMILIIRVTIFVVQAKMKCKTLGTWIRQTNSQQNDCQWTLQQPKTSAQWQAKYSSYVRCALFGRMFLPQLLNLIDINVLIATYYIPARTWYNGKHRC